MHKISIIIPIYNVEKYLRECLESIVNQTLNDIEIICVNDGSPDNSLGIIEEYAAKDERIVIISKENGGYASAINAGLEVAKGEFIQIVESDDFCDLNMCEEMYNKIAHTDADFVTADFYYFKSYNSIKKRSLLKKEDKNIEHYNIKTLPYIIKSSAFPWKSLYRAEFLRKNDIKMLQDGNGAYEDQPWNASTLSLANKILYLNKPFYYYRIFATGSSSNCGKRNMINYITRRRQALNILKTNNVWTDEIKEYFCASALSGCLHFFKIISFDFKEEYYNKMQEFLQELLTEKITYKYFSKKLKNNYNKILKNDYKHFYKTQIMLNKIKSFFNKKEI